MTTSLLRNWSTGMVGATFIALGITVTAPSHATTLTSSATYGDDMAGMVVTAGFLNGGSQTATWGVTGSNAGGAFGTKWSLTQSGNTFSNPWTFSNSGQSIVSLKINAVPGNTVFDIVEDYELTPGSADGEPFTVVSGSAPNSFAYSDAIDISKGDLFGTLSLNYNNGFTGKLTYIADTDSGTQNDPVVVAVTPNNPVVVAVTPNNPGATPVPFEFSPGLMILVLGAASSIAQLGSKKYFESVFSNN